MLGRRFELVMYLVLLPFLVIPNLMVIGEAMKQRPVTIPVLEKRRRITLIGQIIVSIPSVYFLPNKIGIPVVIVSFLVVVYYNVVMIPSQIRQLQPKGTGN